MVIIITVRSRFCWRKTVTPPPLVGQRSGSISGLTGALSGSVCACVYLKMDSDILSAQLLLLLPEEIINLSSLTSVPLWLYCGSGRSQPRSSAQRYFIFNSVSSFMSQSFLSLEKWAWEESPQIGFIVPQLCRSDGFCAEVNRSRLMFLPQPSKDLQHCHSFTKVPQFSLHISWEVDAGSCCERSIPLHSQRQAIKVKNISVLSKGKQHLKSFNQKH